MPSKVPNSDKSKDNKPSDGSLSRPDLTGSSVVNAEPVDTTALQTQFLRGQDVQTIMTSQANLIKQVLASFSEAQARTTQQILTTFFQVVAKTNALETQVLSSFTDTSNKLQWLENLLSTLSQDATKLAEETKLSALEK